MTRTCYYIACTDSMTKHADIACLALALWVHQCISALWVHQCIMGAPMHYGCTMVPVYSVPENEAGAIVTEKLHFKTTG